MDTSKLKSTTSILFAGLLAGMALNSSQALAQNNKQLILQTQPEPTVVELEGSVQIDGIGNILVTPADAEICTATGSCEGVEVVVDSFTVNGQDSAVSVNQGQNLNFRWSSRGAWACDGTGLSGWTGANKSASHSSGVNVNTSNVPVGEYEVSLNCYNGSVLASTTPSITIEINEADQGGPPDPGVPAMCSSRKSLPSNWNRLTTGSNSCSYRFPVSGLPGGNSGVYPDHDCRQFNKVFNRDWIGRDTTQRAIGAPGSNGGRHYVAMGFNSGDVPTSGPYSTITFNQPQTSSLKLGFKQVSISRCPGDFDEPAIKADMGAGCIVHTSAGGVVWGGPHYKGESNVCALDPNTDYYLNVIYTNQPIGTPVEDIEPPPQCIGGAGCGSRFTPSSS